LGIIHKHFKPISEEIKDYIAKPKPNGYRSLHTTIFSREGKITEVQIRTEEMQKEAEYGVCAHWAYKEKINLNKEGEDFEWPKNTPDFWKAFKISFYANKVFTFTPKGDVIALPKNSTPVDFAYAVHSDIGNHCEFAKINNKIVPLNHQLDNGDIVSITVNKNKKPSKDWLRFVKTSLAKSNIKKLTEPNRSVFKFPIPNFIRKKFTEISEASKRRREEKKKIEERKARQIYIAGQKGMLVHVAKCCNPQPGDKVKAYLAQNRATILHRISCSILKETDEKFPDKIIDASWE
jgi:GTP pyrophosphokinase